MAIAAISRALTAVFSDDCKALTAARSAVLGTGILLAPLIVSAFVRILLPPTPGDSSEDDSRDGIDPASDGALEIILFGFSADPCFKKVFTINEAAKISVSKRILR
jgi:hypothetical protein